MEGREIFVVLRFQMLHEEAGYTRSELVLQLYAEFPLVGIGGPFRDPIECHCDRLVKLFNIENLFESGSGFRGDPLR